jgi:serine/threonine protein kinase
MSKTMVGQTINNHYLLTEVLGEGGMGIVFKAEDLNLNRRLCAIKILKGQTTDPNEAKRFEAELQIISRLRSPHVVQVLNKGYFEGHRLYIVMELLEGEPLSTLIKKNGALEVKRVIQISKGILAGLSEAHDFGVVHRDLKPANIFITRSRAGDEITKVLDFGIAKDTNKDDVSGLTSASMIIGTPKYMAPEQFMKNDTDQRTDLYAVGLLLYQMLCGYPPYVPDSDLVPDTLRTMPNEFKVGWLHLNADPKPLEVFPPLWDLCKRLLEKQPDARPRGAADVIAELNEISERLISGSNPYFSQERHTPLPNRPQHFNSGGYQSPVAESETPKSSSGQRRLPSELVPNNQVFVDDPSTTGIPLISEFNDSQVQSKSGGGWMVWFGIAMIFMAIGGGGYIMKKGLLIQKKSEVCYHKIKVSPPGVYLINKSKLRQVNGQKVPIQLEHKLGQTNANGHLPTIVQLVCGEAWQVTAIRSGYEEAQTTIKNHDTTMTHNHQLKAKQVIEETVQVKPTDKPKDTLSKRSKPKEPKKLTWRERLKLRQNAKANKRKKARNSSSKKRKRQAPKPPPRAKSPSQSVAEPKNTEKTKKKPNKRPSPIQSPSPGLMF